MSAVLAQRELPVVIGAAFEGGFFYDRVMVDRNPHAIIVSPKVGGEHPDAEWYRGKDFRSGSYNDSYANTVALAKAGWKPAQWALDQQINGLKDWSIPARDLLERMYFHGKPGARPNGCWFRDGENPSAIPPAYPYTEAVPAQTTAEAFRTGGAEAMDEVPYWSSTPFEASDDAAWAQDVGNGDQGDCDRSNEFRVRLVRVIPL